MGLLDILNNPEMQMGMGLLAAGGPTTDPNQTGFGQRMGNAMNHVQNWQQQQAKMEMQKMQMEEVKQKMAQEKQMREMAARFQTPAQSALPSLMGDAESGIMPSNGSPAVPAGFDFQGYAGALAGVDPIKSMELQRLLQKDNTPLHVKADETLVDPRTFKPVFTAPKSMSLPAAVQEYNFAKEQGYGGSFIEFQLAQKKAGATNVNNTVSMAGPENEYNKTIGKTLADESTALVSAAKTAPMVVDNARMIKSALDKGAITGTGADTRLVIQKAAETMGFTQPGTAATTQQLMSGLGKLTLSGIKTSGLGGGNGFTDKDREFLNSAISGTISDTPENLRRVADLSERVAIATHAKGAKVLDRWKANPSLGAVAQDSQIDPIPTAPAAMPLRPMAAPIPMKGMVRNGYKFKGGDPSNQANWEQQ